MTSISDAVLVVQTMQEASALEQDPTSLSFLLNGRDTGYIETENGVVTEIVLHPNASDALPLSDLIAAYGSPAEVRVRRCPEGTCEVALLYPKHGMVASLLRPKEGALANRALLLPTSGISRIALVPDVMAYEASFPGDGSSVTPWKGYTAYP
jgi:hypothetical protein